MTLHDLARKHGTDKAWHGFARFYEPHLPKHPNKILEIGIHEGASLRMWQDFYPNAEVIGADFDKARLYNVGKIKSYLCNQESRENLTALMNKVGKCDIIIDDGGHTIKQQQVSLATLLPWCKYYVLEDLHTSTYVGDKGKSYGVNEDTNTTLNMLISQNYFSEYLKTDESLAIEKMIKSVKIFYHHHDKDLSVTAIIETNA